MMVLSVLALLSLAIATSDTDKYIAEEYSFRKYYRVSNPDDKLIKNAFYLTLTCTMLEKDSTRQKDHAT